MLEILKIFYKLYREHQNFAPKISVSRFKLSRLGALAIGFSPLVYMRNVSPLATTQTGKFAKCKQKEIFFTKYCTHNTCIFERFCAPRPALSRQKIAHLDSPYILVSPPRISNAHGGSSHAHYKLSSLG